MTGNARRDTVLRRIEELVTLASRLDDEEKCPLPPDHIRVSSRQRCPCDACAARAALDRALAALRSLARTHARPAETTGDERWMGPSAGANA